ncbi:21989_t:CDS:1, partial [Dentiscutata erythropus]
IEVDINNLAEVSSNSRDFSEENYDVMKYRREKYAIYKKKFNTALELYEREINNDNFVNNFDKLMMPILKEIDDCESVLQSHKQQATWKTQGKLAF